MIKKKNEIDTDLGPVESVFADLVWENEPLKTSALVSLCAEKLNWKRTTTYTVLKKFCERGLFRMENSVVSAVIPRSEFYALKSERFVEEEFDGSLAAFVSAFASVKKISPEELEELRRMIAEY